MIPDPSTAGSALGEDGTGSPARDDHHGPSRAGHHHCVVCGQPLDETLRDMWVFASPTSVAYLVCLFELMGEQT